MAFEELIKNYQKNIFAIASKFAENQDDAADMAQEIMIKIFRNLKQFKGNSKFSTWLYRVAMNTCIDEKKKRQRHTAYSLDKELETDEGGMSLEIEDEGPTPEEALEKKKIKEAVHQAIGELNDEHKKIIILRDIQGLPYDEIARILNCSEGTVKSRINRGRAQLKKILLKNRELF